MADVISVDSLTKRYGRLCAVDSLSFSVAPGVCFGLLGPNGAGKTTTIEMLEGLVKPTFGSMTLFGQPISKAIYNRVGIQFQHTALPDHLNVYETLKLFASFYPVTTPIDTLLGICKLQSIAKQRVRKLSGGQRQRMLLALAIINDPDLIFLDEPTTGLDPQARRQFWQLIETIKAQGKTIVLTTHYMDEAQVLCDDIAIMNDGQIIEQGAPRHLLDKHFSGAIITLPVSNVLPGSLSIDYTAVNERLEITTNNIEATLHQIVSDGGSLSGLQIKQASLDDLFLKLTGHELGGAQQ